MKKNYLKIIPVAILLLIVTIGCKKDKNVTHVTLNQTNITLTIGETATLTATVYPDDAANKAVGWTSSNPNVATVTGGIVTAREVGEATITVITADGGYTATCAVEVVPEKGVLINGVRWATSNVDAPGTFAANPEDAGMFYQWNRKVGWSNTDPMINSNGGTTWNETVPEGTTWEKANDPCPAGWRVPTVSELESLIDAGSQWTTLNDVIGRIFGSDDQTLFLPAAGHRCASRNGDLHYVDISGYYWSSSNSFEDDRTINLGFSEFSAILGESARRAGFSIRCVVE